MLSNNDNIYNFLNSNSNNKKLDNKRDNKLNNELINEDNFTIVNIEKKMITILFYVLRILQLLNCLHH